MTVTAAMPVIDMVATGRNIQRLREQNGMSVRDLQEKFGFSSPQSIYKWQWGQTLPDYQNMLFLAALWNVSVEEILVLENPDFFYPLSLLYDGSAWIPLHEQKGTEGAFL
ncbi:MAG: helix-turn-helix transcriptional regulator [Solobacterium sp.]|nr:helix-turn-helix transcriptional regulator [Solobacterium sp.]